MSNYLKGFTTFFCIFLLWTCQSTTDPILPSPIQSTRMFLGGGVNKSWNKVTVEYRGNSSQVICEPDSLWTFKIVEIIDPVDKLKKIKDTVLFVNSYKRLPCSSSDTVYQVKVDTAQGKIVVKTYKILQKNVMVGLQERKILMISEKEFVSEQTDIQGTKIERFRAN